MSGLVTATVRNLGAIDVEGPYQVLFFEDTNLDEAYDPAEDVMLGSAIESTALAPGASRQVLAPLSGTVRFSETRIWAYVDAAADVIETHEENNLATSGEECQVLLPSQPIDIAVKWFASITGKTPGADVSPTIVDLNGDGTQDIVFVGMVAQPPAGRVRALDGRDGTQLWARLDLPAEAGTVVAAADVDGQLPGGDVEVELFVSAGRGMMALEHDGTLRWQVSVPPSDRRWSNPLIADLDQDGTPEILINRMAYDIDGALLWQGQQTRKSRFTAVADLDLDGRPEVLVGGRAYRYDGTVAWDTPAIDTSTSKEMQTAVGQFDADPYPEIVVTELDTGEVWLLEHDGSVVWGPVLMPAKATPEASPNVGPPAIGDADGDGTAEIGVAGWQELRIMRADGSTMWTAPINDLTSGASTPTFFDLDGDGRPEVIFADQDSLDVYRGSDGVLLYQRPRHSHTATDMVSIADLEGDGQVEIIVGINSQGSGPNGIEVLTAAAGTSWVAGRSIWNQATYHVGNVRDEGTVPALEENSWQRHNTYRVQESYGGRAVDLVPSLVRVGTAMMARVGNAGRVTAPAGIAVAFYEGDPAAGTLLGVARTSAAIGPGAYEDVTLVGPVAAVLPHVWADHDGAGAEQLRECNEANNIYDPTRAPANGAPVAIADGYGASEDQVLSVAVPGVLGNDSDPDGDRLAAVLDTPPGHGTLSVRTTGDFVYTPDAEYSGADAFEYHATDGRLDSVPVAVTLTVAAVNDPPVAEDQSQTLWEDTPLAITLTARDPDSGQLSYTVLAQPGLGTLSGTPPDVLYTPDRNAYGMDSLTFRADDGQASSNVATVSLRILGVNDPPEAFDQSITAYGGLKRFVTLVGTDAEHSALSYDIVDPPAHGRLRSFASNPNKEYTADVGYVGPDGFSFRVNDGQLDSNVATVTITVLPYNNAPVAFDQQVTTAEDTALPITLTGADPDGDPLTYRIVTQPGRGTLAGTPPAVTYTPAQDDNGPESFRFVVNDGTVDSAPATVSITVTAVNDAPVAVPQSVTTPFETAVVITLTGSDPDGDALTFAIATAPANGTLAGAPPSLAYTPNAGFSGADAFDFTVSDGQLSGQATVSITVTGPANQPPDCSGATAAPSVLTPIDGSMVPIQIQGVTDPDGDPVTITPTAIFQDEPVDGDDDSEDCEEDDSSSGPDGILSPLQVRAEACSKNGRVYHVYFDATDSVGATCQGEVTVCVPGCDDDDGPDSSGEEEEEEEECDDDDGSTPLCVDDGPVYDSTRTGANRAPVADDQLVNTTSDVAVAVVLTGVDPDGDALSYSVVTQPQWGSLSGAGANLSYAPSSGWSGLDSFTFQISDGRQSSNVATVTVAVSQPGNAVPDCSAAQAKPAQLTPVDGRMVPVEVTGITDPEGGAVSVIAYAIYQDEPVDDDEDGCEDDSSPDGYLSPLSVRAESCAGNGRVYHIWLYGVDAGFGACAAEVTLCAAGCEEDSPGECEEDDPAGGGSCIDDGPAYDSTSSGRGGSLR